MIWGNYVAGVLLSLAGSAGVLEKSVFYARADGN